MRALAFTLCVIGLLAGCGDENAATTGDDKPYALTVSDEALVVAESAGVDLERLVAAAADKVFAALPSEGKIGIDVGVNDSRVVPEIGVGGTIDPGKGDVFVSIAQKPSPGYGDRLRTWVPATLARELYLSSRIRTGPGFGVTLGEALVSYGLSDHFVEEMFPATPPQPWNHRPLSPAQEAKLWRRAKPDLEIPGGYDHPLWFFGAGGKNALPRWASYTLAYRIVDSYIDDEKRATDAVGTGADAVISPYKAAHP